jgi:hypothetical protein
MNGTVLPLANMHERHPGLTAAMAEMLFEAASVCLSRHHSSPTVMIIESGAATSSAEASWLTVTAQLRAAYANTIDTTEAGAYGVCLAAVELQAGLVAIQRAETLSGADYYVAPLGSPVDDLEEARRLEVSGVDKGRRALCDQRLRAKVQQTVDSGHPIPAMAAVAGFEQRLILLSSVVPA